MNGYQKKLLNKSNKINFQYLTDTIYGKIYQLNFKKPLFERPSTGDL